MSIKVKFHLEFEIWLHLLSLIIPLDNKSAISFCMCFWTSFVFLSFLPLEFCHPDLLKDIWNDTLNFCNWRIILPESSWGIRRSLFSLQDCMHQVASYTRSQSPGQGSTSLKFAADADSGLYVVFMSTNLTQVCWMGSYKEAVFPWEVAWIRTVPNKHHLNSTCLLYCLGPHKLTRIRFWHFMDMLSKGPAVGLGKVNKDG